MTKLSDVVSKAAPVLGAALGGVGAPIGLIVSGIAKLFGADGEDDLLAKIKADPEAYVKLRQFELEHQYDLERIVASDRDSARNREARITEATHSRDWVMDAIAIVMVFGFFGMCFIVTFFPVNKINADLMYMVIGQFSTGFITVLAYYFGATRTSAALAQKQLPPPAQTK